MEAVMSGHAVSLSKVADADIDALWQLEQRCFTSDRLSKRRMRFYMSAPHAEFVLARANGLVVGYALLLCRRGTLLTRLYSIAVDPEARGLGIAAQLIDELERRALLRGKPFMRLEVAVNNRAAIALYEKLGFHQFGIYNHYYEDESDALRMQKALRMPASQSKHELYPWYQQSTEFTCGPAALMMAMTSLNKHSNMSQHEELTIWRQATTIYMTSGHGGSHPVGLALSAHQRNFEAEVWMNQALPLFTDGVRSEHKKQIIELVETDFAGQARKEGVAIRQFQWQLSDIETALDYGKAVVCLISTYAFDKRKAPHWVVITGVDDQCVYIHDPDPGDDEHVEFQHIPLSREDFLRLATYGKRKIRTAVIIGPAA
ncbi:GNAT family N-acetyltransferase/peptidase C39 family protein [Salinimonas profundi]|nr:GNAT family N-acetyltransferase/peptidase C39 family protein [Salinimonas profundi]